MFKTFNTNLFKSLCSKLSQPIFLKVYDKTFNTIFLKVYVQNFPEKIGRGSVVRYAAHRRS